LAVVLSPGGAAGSAGAIEGYEWDFTGDGSWDTGVSLNAQNYTYLAAGTYTAKMRVKATNGEYSGVCGVTITVN
jgi:PKD repeat protein